MKLWGEATKNKDAKRQTSQSKVISLQSEGGKEISSVEPGHSRRTFGLGIFFLTCGGAALFISQYIPAILGTLFKYYVGIASATENVEFAFRVIALLCFAISLIVLVVAFFEWLKRKKS